MSKKKGGRPKTVEINENDFVELCEFQCTAEEIAAWFKCSVDSVERWVKATYGLRFAEVFEQKRKGGHVSLRRAQFQAALSGNITMLIWLGKQYLGQSDVEKSERQQLSEKLNEIHETINVLKLVKEG